MATLTQQHVHSKSNGFVAKDDDIIWLKWLQSLKLLCRSLKCDLCNGEMILISRKSRLDGHVWYCRVCSKQHTVRKNSLFECFPKLKLQAIIRYIWLWSQNIRGYRQLKGLGVASSKCTISKLHRLLDSIAIRALHDNPIAPQGGQRRSSVQIDESLFVKRKYNRGRLVQQRWVLGILVKDYNPPRPIYTVVPDRSARTLLPIIYHYVNAGTHITTDCWRSYGSLNSFYRHATVNHSRSFVNPNTGAHTQDIECEWAHAKRFVKSIHPRTSDPVDLQKSLDVYMWKKWLGCPYPGGPYVRILQDIRDHFGN